MHITNRAGWGAKAATCSTPLPAAAVKGVAIHYSGALAEEKDDHSKCAGVVKSIQNYHMSKAVDGGKGPWCDIAYSFLVCRHGEVFEGRGWKNRTAAQGTNAGNDNYVAICFLGGDKEGRDDVTPKGREPIAGLINMAQNEIFKKKLDIEPHSHFHSTGCPGDELRGFIKNHGWEHHQ